MTLLHFLKALRAYWWLVVLMCLAGAVAGAGLKAASSTVYTSRSSVIVTPRLQGGADAGSMATFAQGLMPSYSALVTGQPTLESVARQLGDGSSWSDLQAEVQTEVPAESTIIRVTVKDADPSRAAAIANAIPAALNKTVAGLGTGGTPAPVTINQIDRAQPASVPDGFSLPTAAATGALVGLIAGLVLAGLVYTVRLREALEHR